MGSQPTTAPSVRIRLAVVVLTATLSGLLCYLLLTRTLGDPSWPRRALSAVATPLLPEVPASGDFTWLYRAATHLAQGQNPYQEIQSTGRYPFNAPFYYPLTAAIIALPVIWLSPKIAGAVMFGLVAGLLAWALSREGFRHFWLFLSPSFLMCANHAQIGPLIVISAAFVPVLGGLLTIKPNLGMVMLLYRPSWKAAGSAAVLLATSLLLLPTWPMDWIRSGLGQHQHVAPVQLAFAGILGLAAAYLRDPRGRLFFGMAVMPQVLDFYDQLPLALVANGRRQALFLLVCNWAVYLVWRSYAESQLTSREFAAVIPDTMKFVGYGMYLPALLLLLWRDMRPPLRSLIARLRALAT